MSFELIIRNTVRVTKLVTAGGPALFREASTRTPIETQPEGGIDRRFQVSAMPVAMVFPRHGIIDNVRNVDVTVRLGYFRGGGDAGGGDRLSVDARAYDDCVRLGAWLTNPLHYDSQVSGIQTVTERDWVKALDLDRTVFWDLRLAVQWEQLQDVRAVA